MEERIISNCAECPFCNYDGEYGKDGCNLQDNIFPNETGRQYEEMPDDHVHSDCPLLKSPVTVRVASSSTASQTCI